jgi:DNA-binding PucR family transcriptional regulator
VAGGSDGPPDDEPELDSALAGVAGALRADLPRLVARVDAAVRAAVPALAADPDVRLALQRSTEAHIADGLALLGDATVPLDSGVPPESLSLAGVLVRRGAEPGDLVHAYLVGQNEFWRAWMEELTEQLPSGPELVVALERSSARLFARADFLVARLMRHIDRERERWMGGALARRTQLVGRLLAGDEPDVVEASRSLGYDIDRWVLAAVLWDAGGGEDPEALEAQAAVAARVAGVSRAFTLAPGEAGLWAWVATSEPPDLDAIAAAVGESLAEGQAVAFGTPDYGLQGFRRGHEEALLARRVAELGHHDGVTRYDEVELVSLASTDLDRLCRFVRRTLGPLTADDESTARLRETLLAWLAEGGNARRAAERLHAHKNTVLYRLQRAQQLIGRPLDQDRGALELALSAVRSLGPHVTSPPAPPGTGRFVRSPEPAPAVRPYDPGTCG